MIIKQVSQKTATTPSEYINVQGVGSGLLVVQALTFFEQLIEKVLHADLRFLPILGRVICCMHCLSLSK